MNSEIVSNLIRWTEGEMVSPYEVELRITNRCNLKCLSCGQRVMDKIDYDVELPKNKWLDIVKEACEMEVKQFHICGGGEPMARAETTVGMMNIIKKYNTYGKLITNGTLFTEDVIKNLVRIGWDEIVFSLDGPDPETNDYLRGVPGTFDMIINAMRLFQSWKDRLNKEKPIISIAPVLSNQNYDKLSEMLKLANNVGAKNFCIQLMIVANPNCEKLTLNKDQRLELQKNVATISRLSEKYGVNCNIDDFSDEKLIEKSSKKGSVIKSDIKGLAEGCLFSSPCFFPWIYMGIFADGTVQPCADMPIDGDVNIRDESLSEIWHGNYFNSIRQRLMEKKLFLWCQKCCGNKIFETRLIRKKLLAQINR